MDDLVEHVVALPGRELLLLAPRDGDALLSEEAFEQEEFLPYWAELWPSALALARVVSRRPLTGRRTIELGCGLGLPAIAAALAGRRACSRPTGRRTPSRSPRATPSATASCSTTAVFRWDADPRALGPPWPLVLASDVLYEHRNVAPLLALLPRLCAAAGEVWLADPRPRAGRRVPRRRRRAVADRRDPARRTRPRHGPPAARRSALEVGLQPRERLRRLALGRAGDEHAAGHAAEEPARLRVLVAVVEARAVAAVELDQRVDDAARASRPVPCPPRPRGAARRTRPATSAP